MSAALRVIGRFAKHSARIQNKFSIFANNVSRTAIMHEDLNGLRSNIARLIALYEAEKQRADSLAVRLSASEVEVRRYEEQIADLNLQIDKRRLTSAFLAGDDKEQAREKISRLIGEIDRCIKLLES